MMLRSSITKASGPATIVGRRIIGGRNHPQHPIPKRIPFSTHRQQADIVSGGFLASIGRLWERYTAALIARPLLVKASTASCIFFVSDSATQNLMGDGNDYDLARSGSAASFGVVATGWLHYWWSFLEVAVEKRIPAASSRFMNTITKVVVDQLVGAPIYIYTYYVITHFGKEYMSTASTNGAPDPSLLFRDTCDRATEMLPPTMLRHWTLWPAVHTLNFYYNPLHHRVLVQNLVLVGWSAYLSHLNNGGLLMTPEEEVEVAETVELHRRESIRHQHSTSHAEIHIKGTANTSPLATTAAASSSSDSR